MKWKQPPVIKIYEALGAVADGRVEVSGDTAKVYSSTGNKFYDVTYDPAEQAIMTNDNGSYWKENFTTERVLSFFSIYISFSSDLLYNLVMSIAEITEKITPILKQYGIKKASIFGSFSRGDERPDSDVDLLVRYDKNRTMGIYEYMDMVDVFKKTLGREVDVVGEDNIN